MNEYPEYPCLNALLKNNYDDTVLSIKESDEVCPFCGYAIGKQLKTLLVNDPCAKYLYCGACETQLEIIEQINKTVS
jgi:formate dehydrogenase maturation protein FdhE